MSKDWRPVIDEGRCKDGCHKCEVFCPQRVFKRQGLRPVVENPEQCVDGCEGCKSICPTGAISFIRGRVLLVNGQAVSVAKLDEALSMGSAEDGFLTLLKHNYVPEEAKAAYRKGFESIF
jgi:NAD-dependent dihydropyrimidine dehydrogenase PreA subunit